MKRKLLAILSALAAMVTAYTVFACLSTRGVRVYLMGTRMGAVLAGSWQYTLLAAVVLWMPGAVVLVRAAVKWRQRRAARKVPAQAPADGGKVETPPEPRKGVKEPAGLLKPKKGTKDATELLEPKKGTGDDTELLEPKKRAKETAGFFEPQKGVEAATELLEPKKGTEDATELLEPKKGAEAVLEPRKGTENDTELLTPQEAAAEPQERAEPSAGPAFCPNCGYPVSGKRFCAKCGTKVGE